ncbi:MAG TPA: ABC transporter permease [Candidatus Polarisedimenticolia bacterium]|jgi:ABC-2 type transport system permease protein
MHKLLAIIRREYVESVRTKAFIISTLLVPVLMSAAIFLPQFLARTTPQTRLRVGVVDSTGKVFQKLDGELALDREKDFLEGGERRYLLSLATPEQAAMLDPNVPGPVIDQMEVDALVEIGEGVISGEERPTYYSGNVGDFQPIKRIEDALSAVVIAVRLGETSLTPDQVRSLARQVDMKSVKIDQEGKASERDFMHEYLTAVLFTIALYSSTLMSGMALSRGLLEEKANRVVEVLISSVTPFQLMTGKILGQALVILSQLGIWAMLGFALYARGASAGQTPELLAGVTPSLLAYLVLYFLLGYFLYAALFAGVGAVCTTEMEAQQTQMPLVLMQIFPFLMAMAIVRQPGSTLAVVLSMIPFFTPSVMVMRLALSPPPALQVVASIAILVFAVIAALWVVSKVFRVGILMTGKKMTLGEMVRWVRAA